MTNVAATRAEFDRLAALESIGALRHSEDSFGWLLARLPARVERIAEVGCGAGTLTTLLARRASHVLAIDLSPEMLRLARERCELNRNVSFEEADADEWSPAAGAFDAVVSVATLHHLHAERVLPRWAAALRPGGVLLVVDVLDRPGIAHLAVNAVAAAWSGWRRWRRTGSPFADARVRAAWAAHERFDRLPTIGDARRSAEALLPGARVRHHLLWRYSIEWRAPTRVNR